MDAITTRADAMKRGERQYFNGKPCVSGHKAPRDTVSGYCCMCRLLRQNQTRQAARLRLKSREAA